jgi:hypothetical protein
MFFHVVHVSQCSCGIDRRSWVMSVGENPSLGLPLCS